MYLWDYKNISTISSKISELSFYTLIFTQGEYNLVLNELKVI